MHRRGLQPALLTVAIVLVAFADATAQPPAPVPPIVKFGGVAPGGPGVYEMTFALYAEQGSETPLWTETQQVQLDGSGRYAVHLGSSRPEGLPPELFASGEPRWLGVRVAGQLEQPRVLLVSVPYALKAADADTVAGKPLSAFVLAGDRTGVGADGLTYVDTRVLKQGLAAAGPAGQGAGTPGAIGKFVDAVTLGDSVIFQNGWNVGIGTTVPAAALHSIAIAAPGALFDVYSNSLGALPVVYRAARGTPSSPSPVQTDDILGGLAVRGYGATGFTAGRGQVMFKAAENWTDSANGTYLQLTTTPVGGTGWVERMRVTPDGNVGIGTATPGQKLSVAGTVESTTGGFRFPDGTTQVTAGQTAGTVSAFGLYALRFNTGANNSAFGFNGLGSNTAGTDNSAFGYLSLTTNTTGSNNAAFGSMSLYYNTTGGSNSAFGSWALNHNSTGSSNTAVGAAALVDNTTGMFNTAVGANCLFLNETGWGNSAAGSSALQNNLSGGYNSAFGLNSMQMNSTGTENAAFGYFSLLQNVGGNYNAAFGSRSLRVNTASSNAAFGYSSLTANTDGTANAAFGASALSLNTTGDYDTGLGFYALSDLTGGSYNTAVGTYAGNYLVTGSHNAFLGWNARVDQATGPALEYATAIGANAVVGQSYSMALGGSGFYAVSVGIGTPTPVERLQVVGDVRVGTSGTLGCVRRFDGGIIAGTCSSDARLKSEVRPFAPVLDRVARLQPVHFTWKAEEYPAYHFGAGLNSGLIAQEVEQVFPELVATDERGYKMVNYSELPLLTLAAVRELKAGNDALKVENDSLRAQLAALAERLAKLEKTKR